MSPDERLRLTRAIPPDLTPEDVVLRHGNAMQGPSDPCWYVSIRGKAVPGFYTPEDAAKLRAQILEVSEMRALFEHLAAQTPIPGSTGCPLCGDMGTDGRVCPSCIDAYQLASKAPADDIVNRP